MTRFTLPTSTRDLVAAAEHQIAAGEDLRTVSRRTGLTAQVCELIAKRLEGNEENRPYHEGRAV